MVKLYGVIHGMWVQEWFGDKRDVPLSPGGDLLNDLVILPKGSRIGLEWFSDKDDKLLKEHVRRLLMDADPDIHIGYPKTYYWKNIENACVAAGHEVIFLEELEQWKRYNEATLEYAKCLAAFREIIAEKGETEEQYEVKRLTLLENRYRAEIVQRRIHETERDQALLTSINRNGLNAAVVGIAHGDLWMSQREQIEKEFGIKFEDYTTETRDSEIRYGNKIIFLRNAVPNPELVFEKESLERTIRFLHDGRITDRTPDYVGIWDLAEPMKGYFELFIEERGENGAVSGTIEDCLGSAKFSGVQNSSEFNFDKRYQRHEMTAIKTKIEYKGKQEGDVCSGHFWVDGFGQAFYMIKKPKAHPHELAKAWRVLMRGEKQAAKN